MLSLTISGEGATPGGRRLVSPARPRHSRLIPALTSTSVTLSLCCTLLKTALAVATLVCSHHHRLILHTYKSPEILLALRPLSKPLSRSHSSRRIQRDQFLFPSWPRKRSTLARYSLLPSLASFYIAGSPVLPYHRQHPRAGMVDVKSTLSMSKR